MSTWFEQSILVAQQHIDALGHVNNVTYMHWMQDIALAHTTTLGLGLEDYIRLGHAMVASEHRVKYRKACFLGETLLLRTWLGALTPFSTTRHYLFYRPQDQAVVFEAHSLFVCVELSSGKLKRLSATFNQAYQPLSLALDPTKFQD